MKKLISTLLFSFIISASFCATPKLFDFTGGISSGFPIYGTPEVKETIHKVDNANRIILGTFANINLNPTKYTTFYTGADLLADFSWNSDVNADFFHVNFPIGIKIYPNIAGLNFGIAYTVGFCGMIIKDEFGEKTNATSPWGNGTKFSIEYDFARNGKIKILPAIGVAWNIMPRGFRSYDNIISMYISEHF